MDAGDTPEEACLYALEMISDKTRAARLQRPSGKPNFQVLFYAVRKDGMYGSASMWSGRQFAVSDQTGARREDCAFLYDRADW